MKFDMNVKYDGIVVYLDIPYFKISVFWDSYCSSAIGTRLVLLCTQVFSCIRIQDKISVRFNVATLDINKMGPTPYSC